MSTRTGVWKKVILTLINDFKGFEASVEGVTVDVIERAREQEVEMWAKDVTQLLKSNDKT